MEGSQGKVITPDQWPDGTGMIYFGMSPWAGMWKSRHQLMSRFSRSMPVLYVQPWVGLRSLRSQMSGISRIFADLGRPLLEKHEPNVHVFNSPAYFPVSRSPSLAPVTQRMWTGAVRRAARSIGITRPIVWVSRPETGFVVGQMNEQLSIYHVVDEYAGYTGAGGQARAKLAGIEAVVLDSVDLVIVASPELERAKQGRGRDIVVLENGVEPGEYADARRAELEPDDLADVSKPRIGYSGLIGKRLDLELIREIALRRPDCSVVLIGKVDARECEEGLAALESLPNVYLLGEKPATEVARYVVGFDIGLLPYAINLETQHISPIKMYEYWAAGKPVVATSIPAAQRNRSAVNVAESHDEFHSMIDRILDAPNQEDPDRLIELAGRNSWQSRVDRVTAELGSRIGDS
ncbi:MAG: glycosyltransferase [Woeseiaceae bacterium]|nr:glycosyltransferase [Woeseiaceae bacterium]